MILYIIVSPKCSYISLKYFENNYSIYLHNHNVINYLIVGIFVVGRYAKLYDD